LLLLLPICSIKSQDCDDLPPFFFEYNNESVNTPLSLQGGTTVRIKGTVNFNANVTMVNCTILMDPGAVLNINNSTFTMQDADNNAATANDASVIFACNQMWQSINVNHGAAIIWRNSLIQGGRQGVVFAPNFNNAITELTGNTFRNNSVSITAGSVKNLTFSAFRGNEFYAAGALLTPHTATEPVYHIWLSKAIGSIGTSGSTNIFRDASTAIRSIDSKITVNNCSFLRNLRTDWFGINAGIWATGSSVTMQNFFTGGYSCQFTNNRRGVYSEQTTQLTVKNAYFPTQWETDIEVVTSINPYNLNISNNIIDVLPWVNYKNSIFVERACMPDGDDLHTRIQSNIITMQSPPVNYGLNGNVHLVEVRAQLAPTDKAVIANNQITCTYGNGNLGSPFARTIDGIWVQDDADGYQISGNIIDYVHPTGLQPNQPIGSVGIGLTLVKGVNNIVGPNNNVTTSSLGANQPFGREAWLHCGIHIDNSPGVYVCKNETDHPRHGYHYAGNCAMGEFGRNTIRSAHYGLLFSTNGGASNTQFQTNHDYRMNMWPSGSTYFERSALWAIGPLGLYWRVDGSFNAEHLPPSGSGTLISPPSWFGNVSNAGESGTRICDAVLPPTNGGDEPPAGDMAVKFVNGEYVFSDTPSAWDFERSLLKQMIRFSTSFSGNLVASQYYSGKVNSAIWQFAKAERMLHDAAEVSSSSQQTLDQLYTTSTILVDSMSLIEEWEAQDLLTNNAFWQSMKSNLLYQINEKQVQIASLLSSIRSQRLADMETAYTYISNLPTTNSLESNYKTLLLLLAKQHTEEEWSQADSIALRAIAYSCMWTGGEAVTMARGMLPRSEAYSFVKEGEDPYCQIQHKSNTSAPTPVLFEVNPNPASDQFLVTFKQDFSGKIELVDMAGIVVQSIHVEKTVQQSLNVQKIANGAYLLRVKNDNGYGQIVKIVIVN